MNSLEFKGVATFSGTYCIIRMYSPRISSLPCTFFYFTKHVCYKCYNRLFPQRQSWAAILLSSIRPVTVGMQRQSFGTIPTSIYLLCLESSKLNFPKTLLKNAITSLYTFTTAHVPIIVSFLKLLHNLINIF